MPFIVKQAVASSGDCNSMMALYWALKAIREVMGGCWIAWSEHLVMTSIRKSFKSYSLVLAQNKELHSRDIQQADLLLINDDLSLNPDLLNSSAWS